MTTTSANADDSHTGALAVGGPFMCALYAAAHRPDTLANVIASQPDLVLLDLEDAVPLELKNTARKLLPQWSIELGHAGIPFVLRVNPVDSTDFGYDVVATAVLLGGSMSGPRGVLIPKVMSQRDVVTAEHAIPGVPIWVMIETPVAVSLASADRFDRVSVAGMVIGMGDLAKHQRISLAEAELDADFLRQRSGVAAAATRAKQHCLDGVVVGDASAALEAGRRSCALGFTGRSVYAPQHVQPCRDGGRTG